MRADAEAGKSAPEPRTRVHGRSALTRAVAVGAGWYLYVYLNAGNINWLRGLGYAAATAALCALLIETVVGSVACGVAAYIVWTIFYRPTTLPPGYCVEFKFTWAGSPAGAKLVKRNC